MLDLKCIIHEDEFGNKGLLPTLQTKGAACADLALPKRVTVEPFKPVKIDLLISFEIPEGYKLVMYPRSSLLINRFIIMPTSIIDWDYRGHVHVPMLNISDITRYFDEGERVAQMELCPIYWNKVNDNFVHLDKERDQNGFGGTGAV